MVITDQEFTDILLKYMPIIMDEVNEKGTTTPLQWTRHLGNLVVATLMTVTDNMTLPRKQAMDDLTTYTIEQIIKQKQFQVSNDNKGLE